MLLFDKNADPTVVVAAAVLHDIGIKEAERKYNSSAAEHQETEGPPVAASILKALDYPDDFIAEIYDIIRHHHHPEKSETENFKILYDAGLLTNTAEKRLALFREGAEPEVDGYLTEAGSTIACDAGLIKGRD